MGDIWADFQRWVVIERCSWAGIARSDVSWWMTDGPTCIVSDDERVDFAWVGAVFRNSHISIPRCRML